MIRRFGMSKLFEEKVKDFSDHLLSNQLCVYEQIVGEGSKQELKDRLQILKEESERRKHGRSKASK